MHKLIDLLKTLSYEEYELYYKNGEYVFTLKGSKSWKFPNFITFENSMMQILYNSSHKLYFEWYKDMICNYGTKYLDYIPSYKELNESGALFSKFNNIFDINRSYINGISCKCYTYTLNEKINYKEFAYIYRIYNNDDNFIVVNGLQHSDIIMDII